MYNDVSDSCKSVQYYTHQERQLEQSGDNQKYQYTQKRVILWRKKKWKKRLLISGYVCLQREIKHFQFSPIEKNKLSCSKIFRVCTFMHILNSGTINWRVQGRRIFYKNLISELARSCLRMLNRTNLPWSTPFEMPMTSL